MLQESVGSLLQRSVSRFLLWGILAQLLKPLGIFRLLQQLRCVGSCLINHFLHLGCCGTYGERLPRDLQLLSERAFPNGQLKPASHLWQRECFV